MMKEHSRLAGIPYPFKSSSGEGIRKLTGKFHSSQLSEVAQGT